MWQLSQRVGLLAGVAASSISVGEITVAEQPGTSVADQPSNIDHTYWVSTTNERVALVECGNEHGIEADGPNAVFGLLQVDGLVYECVRKYSRLGPNRKVPAVVTFFARKCSGYSPFGSFARYACRELVSCDAGVSCGKASCGRSIWYSYWNSSNCRCCCAHVR